jgi:hypothetical protein
MLTTRRPSLSNSEFTETDFTNFVDANLSAMNEDDIVREVSSTIRGKAEMFCRHNVQFIGLEKMSTAVTYNGPVQAKPDYYEGVRLDDIDPRIRRDLRRYIIPHPSDQSPSLPTLFCEYKSEHGSAAVATLQACHDGALGARGIWKLQMYCEPKETFDNKAYTITATYYAGMLTLYTVHPVQSSKFGIEYHQCRIDAYCMIGNQRHFVEAATAFRNVRDWAEKQRRRVLADAHARLAASNGDSPWTTNPPAATPPPSIIRPAAKPRMTLGKRPRDEGQMTAFSSSAGTGKGFLHGTQGLDGEDGKVVKRWRSKSSGQ